MTAHIIAAFAIWNLITFFVTGYDKRAAKRGNRRIPEARFKLFSLCFGGIGIIAGFFIFRHKTNHRKLVFQVLALTAMSGFIAAAIIYKIKG